MQTKPHINFPLMYEPLEETLDIKPMQAELQIGIPKDTFFYETRVPLTPQAVQLLTLNGYRVIVERHAGEHAFFSDHEYSEAGAVVSSEKSEVYKSHIIVKSTPINEHDVGLLQPNQLTISPLHVSLLQKDVLEQMMKKRITAVSFENLKDATGHNPIVRSLSEIAGTAVMLIAGEYLSGSQHGQGKLLGGISGIPPTKVVIIGAGMVAEKAVKAALAMGAEVKVFDNSFYKLQRLQNNVAQTIWSSMLNPKTLTDELATADVAIGALGASEGRTPMLVSEEMVQQMKPGSIIIDVSIDAGGVFETSHPTTLAHPTYEKFGVIHYAVPNIASKYPQTASQAISNVLSTLLVEAADNGGFETFIQSKPGIQKGVYLYKGALTNQYISQKMNLKYTNLQLLLPTGM